ncbi:MAG: TatD family nuclease-associated radical SAM protein [Clostridiales bacterium]|jgi:TatD family-associated radical SAM protein|nr:TatD family nuclease-associated radical SAM protein [Clostridiales bacterium]
MTKQKTDIFVYRVGDTLYINLTNRCCNACTFCIRTYADGVGEGGNLWLSREPSAAEVIAGIKAADFPFDEAVFCGYGECTYRTDVMCAVADYLHGIGKRVRLNTNGLGNLINGRDIVQDLAGRIDVVSVSLNESDAARYDALCRSGFGADAFPALLDFAGRCSAAGIRTVMTVVRLPGVDIGRCEALAARAGAVLRVREKI